MLLSPYSLDLRGKSGSTGGFARLPLHTWTRQGSSPNSDRTVEREATAVAVPRSRFEAPYPIAALQGSGELWLPCRLLFLLFIYF